jgi:conjugative relaxase-like TrwC/TraI family protein
MLTAKPQLNLQHAREYFREHLATGDYYSAGQKVRGEWFGLGAQELGLSGAVEEAAFLRLCEGLHPISGGKLTQRRNSSRRNERGQKVANRRVFYDFTLSPPKSVSVVALCQDDRILELHTQAVRTAMLELEKFAETRVRKSSQRTERATGNIVAATFRHDTSRELDPHLHTHTVVFNATFDRAENRWKALEVQGVYRAQKFVENLYFHELAKGLRSLGYQIENEGRAFRIVGVPESLVARFSKRHQQIDAETKNRITREGLRGNVKALREQVAQEARKRKVKDSTAARLRPFWERQMTAAEASALKALRSARARRSESADVAGIVAWADELLFERRSVVNDYELLAAALARGRGEAFDLTTLRAAVEARGYLRDQDSPKLTSREVLGDELAIVVAAHDGRGRHLALCTAYRASPDLSPEQRTAVERILHSRDLITLFRGGAGTGKSFTLKEVERALVAAGRPVVVLAPQRQQVRDLQAEGLPAETLSRFLAAGALPAGAVVIVDEAGQVGGRQLRQLVDLVQSRRGRLILSGDTRQHGAVPASDALRAIEKHAGLKPAVLRRIRRQDPKLGASARERGFIRRYRAAVKAAAQSDIAGSFDRLDALGCIRECNREERRSALSAEYLAAIARKERTLVVAQTRAEAREVNELIRKKLHVEGTLGHGQKITVWRPVDLGAAQKRDPRFYEPGQSVFFLQRYGRFAKGELCEVAQATERGLILVKGGRRSTLSYRYTNRIAMAAPEEMELAAGDRLQLKFNGKSVEGAPLANGELVTVRRVRRNGALVVTGDDGRKKTLAPTQRLFVRGYAVTSYGSQGKTVDTVILADAATSGATDAKQWYVSISRGRRRVVVFTPDKEELRANVQRAGERELALDLKTEVTPTVRAGDWRRRALAAIERTRLHESAIAQVDRGERQRIAV